MFMEKNSVCADWERNPAKRLFAQSDRARMMQAAEEWAARRNKPTT
jgi:hypothetical protein